MSPTPIQWPLDTKTIIKKKPDAKNAAVSEVNNGSKFPIPNFQFPNKPQ